MIAFICLNSPDLSDLLLVFWLRGWGFKFSQDVQFEFFGGQKVQIGRLEKKPAGSIPGGSGQRVFEGKTWKNMFRIVLDPFVYPCFWDMLYDPRPRNNFVFQRPRLISIWKYEIRPNDLRIIIIYPDIYISIFIWIYAYKYHLYMRDACDTSFDTFLYVGVYASCISIPHESILAFSPPVVFTINSIVWIIVLQASDPIWGLWQADGRLAGMLEDRTWWNLWVFPKQRKTLKKAGINVWPKSVLLHSQLMKH